MDLAIGFSVIILGLLVGALGFGAFLHRKKLAKILAEAQKESKLIVEKARKDADRMVKSAFTEAKNDGRARRRAFEEEMKRKKAELSKLEKKARQKEATLDGKMQELVDREEKSLLREQQLLKEEKRKLRLISEYEESLGLYKSKLEAVATLSVQEAKAQLMESLEEEAKRESREKLKQLTENFRVESALKSQHILSLAVQRVASEYVNESTVTVVSIPNDEMKGRIIGREGRNIRAIEQVTGVDLIIDDTPEAVIISCFHPIRREIAKLTLEKLVADGRIHPARIEETAKRVRTDFDSTLKEYGEQAALDLGISDLHPDIIYLLGKLRFRSTGMQSVLQHSVETAQMCGVMAMEIGLNARRAKRAGLLHDLGKAVDHEIEGHHAEVGADLCKKYGENSEIVDAVRQHHEEDQSESSPLAVILNAANSLSGSRPGARKEALDSYIKRLTDMEGIVAEYEGIESAFVLQAGREVRALVATEGTSDEDVRSMSEDLAQRMRKELTFPGRVRITILKESRHVDYAT